MKTTLAFIQVIKEAELRCLTYLLYHLKMASQVHFLSGVLKVDAIKHCPFMNRRQLHVLKERVPNLKNITKAVKKK